MENNKLEENTTPIPAVVEPSHPVLDWNLLQLQLLQ